MSFFFFFLTIHLNVLHHHYCRDFKTGLFFFFGTVLPLVSLFCCFSVCEGVFVFGFHISTLLNPKGQRWADLYIPEPFSLLLPRLKTRPYRAFLSRFLSSTLPHLHKQQKQNCSFSPNFEPIKIFICGHVESHVLHVCPLKNSCKAIDKLTKSGVGRVDRRQNFPFRIKSPKGLPETVSLAQFCLFFFFFCHMVGLHHA